MNRSNLNKMISLFLYSVLFIGFLGKRLLVGGSGCGFSTFFASSVPGLASFMPLGLFGGLILARSAFKFALFGGLPSTYLPTLIGTLSFRSKSLFLWVVVPVLCISLFIMNPVGGQAFLFSFYWLIPMIIFVIRIDNLFLRALGASFLMHAVGSVLWIYLVPSMPEYWIKLISIVWMERLFVSCSIMTSYYVVNAISLYGLNVLEFFKKPVILLHQK